MKFIKKNWLLLVILAVGFFLRAYKAKALFLYNHDNDLASWIVKDIVVNKHLRLIGQETSTQGVFIGPLFYYLLIPFYLLFNMDPFAGVVLITILGLFSIWSFYFVFSKVFDKRTGLVAGFLYAISFTTIFNDRWVVPTMPVIAWSVWFFYAANLLLKGKQKTAFVIFGILAGLIWHLNVSLVLLLPLIPLSWWLSKKKINWRAAATGLLILVVMSLPLMTFELRHDFVQTRAVFQSLGAEQGDILSKTAKFKKVLNISFSGATNFAFPYLPKTAVYNTLAAVSLLGVLFFLTTKKVFPKKLAIVMLSWIAIYILFFSSYSKIVSEYYLDGILVVWLAILIFSISYLINKKKFRKFGLIILFLLTVVNFYRFFTFNFNRTGYLERKAIVKFIKEDAEEHGYPCISISFITSPGYELGYRYFFWLEEMHVNQPKSGSPVYTIVFPHNRDQVDKIDRTFGALALILPDYSRYRELEILGSCSGGNSNLIDSMFGYTE